MKKVFILILCSLAFADPALAKGLACPAPFNGQVPEPFTQVGDIPAGTKLQEADILYDPSGTTDPRLDPAFVFAYDVDADNSNTEHWAFVPSRDGGKYSLLCYYGTDGQAFIDLNYLRARIPPNTTKCVEKLKPRKRGGYDIMPIKCTP